MQIKSVDREGKKKLDRQVSSEEWEHLMSSSQLADPIGLRHPKVGDGSSKCRVRFGSIVLLHNENEIANESAVVG